MPLGWIDFSKSERNKVLSVLDMLSEAGTLDELGIAPVRDGFADLFFPGTSTIQTRAKYFLIVPYIMKDLEYNRELNPNRMMILLDDMEKNCGIELMRREKDITGIIGSRSISQGKWVKRPPSSIYWAGLRTYGIFNGGNFSITEYIRALCAMKNQKKTLVKLGNRNDQAEENEQDDPDAGNLSHIRFWTIPTYEKDWMSHLEFRLTPEEGSFLKRQIIRTNPDSMMAYILKNGITEIKHCDSFQDLEKLISQFPEPMQVDYRIAVDFSHFLFALRVLYNKILSDEKNQMANEIWTDWLPYLPEIAQKVDLDAIIRKLFLTRNVFLCNFLKKAQRLMLEKDESGLVLEIRRRERELKQGRAKTMHPGEFDPAVWYGGGELDYRFGNAKRIIRDIFESEDQHAESE